MREADMASSNGNGRDTDDAPETPRSAVSAVRPDWRYAPPGDLEAMKEGLLAIDGFVANIAAEQQRSFGAQDARLQALEEGQGRLLGEVGRISRALGVQGDDSLPPVRDTLESLSTEVDEARRTADDAKRLQGTVATGLAKATEVGIQIGKGLAAVAAGLALAAAAANGIISLLQHWH